MGADPAMLYCSYMVNGRLGIVRNSSFALLGNHARTQILPELLLGLQQGTPNHQSMPGCKGQWPRVLVGNAISVKGAVEDVGPSEGHHAG